MKIFCVGRNYVDHAKELNNPVPEQPLIFIKPSTAYLNRNKPFYHPEFSNDIHYELELVLKICRKGKHIAEKFAHRYYDQISVGIDFTARDVQAKFKAKGWPWELAKGFDHSAPIGPFEPLSDEDKTKPILFDLDINGKRVQSGNSGDMIFSFDRLISYISGYFTLHEGDMLFTGTPAGVGQIKIGDRLEGFLNGNKLLDFRVK